MNYLRLHRFNRWIIHTCTPADQRAVLRANEMDLHIAAVKATNMYSEYWRELSRSSATDASTGEGEK